MRRFFALLFVIIFMFSSSLSALAEENEDFGNTGYLQRASFFHFFIKHPLCRLIYGYSLGFVCPESEDGYHRASSYIEEKIAPSGEHYYECVCDLCRKDFTAHEIDLKQSYETQVSELPAEGITSAGRLLWQPTVSDVKDSSITIPNSSYSLLPGEGSGLVPFAYENGFRYYRTFSLSYNSKHEFSDYYSAKFYIPFSGIYSITESESSSFNVIFELGSTSSYSCNYFKSSFEHYSAGSYFSVRGNTCDVPDSSYRISAIVADVSFPVFEVIPDSFINGTPSDEYSSDTRPSSINEINYGIMGDDGKISIVTDNSTIVNETNNTYYNPATGQTSPITNWTYDYTDRSYTLTKQDGDTTTVTYGDENITIREGDTVYNIYYMTDGSSSETPPSTCDHTWTETSRTEPTCSAPGSVKSTCSKCGKVKTEPIPVIDHTWTASDRTDPTCTTPGSQKSTCSKCGESKTEPIPALGHAWSLIRTVPTQYDENGALIQEGYTLYECSRCKEQYKSTGGTGPPGGGGTGSWR